MARVEGRVTINRPPEMVFDFMLDGGNNMVWRSAVIDVAPLVEKPYGVGSVFKQGLKGPGGRIDADYKITECRPNRLIRFALTAGPARSTCTYKFASDGKSTTVTLLLDYQVRGSDKLMELAVTEAMESEVDALLNLKTYLEENFILNSS